LYTSLSSPMRATCPAHLIRLDLTCLIIYLGMSTNYEVPHCVTSSINLFMNTILISDS
jgi:hypothetical protein